MIEICRSLEVRDVAMAEQAALQIGVVGRKSSLRDQNNFAVRFGVRGQGIPQPSGIFATTEPHRQPRRPQRLLTMIFTTMMEFSFPEAAKLRCHVHWQITFNTRTEVEECKRVLRANISNNHQRQLSDLEWCATRNLERH